MCCGGIVAYYVECMIVVKKWYASDHVNRGYQGRLGWFFKLGTTRREPCCLLRERTRVNSNPKYVLADVSFPPLSDTDKCCPPPPSVAPECVLVSLPRV